MKKLILCSVVLILVTVSGCSRSRQLKTKPDDIGSWEICHVCHGYGTVISSSSEKPADDVSNNPANKNSCCLGFSAVSGLAGLTIDNPGDNTAEDREYYHGDAAERNLEIMKDNVPQRSTVKIRVKCPYCEGKGWTKYENINSPLINKDIKIREKDGVIEYE